MKTTARHVVTLRSIQIYYRVELAYINLNINKQNYIINFIFYKYVFKRTNKEKMIVKFKGKTLGSHKIRDDLYMHV